VQRIKGELLDFENKEIPIKSAAVDHVKYEEMGFEFVKVFMIAGAFCHSFTFSHSSGGRIRHHKMLISDAEDLVSMFEGYCEAQGA
jgi:hypothetical protein